MITAWKCTVMSLLITCGFSFYNGGQDNTVTKPLPMCGWKPLVLCRFLVYFSGHHCPFVSPRSCKNMRGVIPVRGMDEPKIKQIRFCG